MDRILFVDDEANVLSAFRRAFRGRHEVDTAANAVEAMEKVLAGERYAVVVSDMNMPGVNGLQLLKQFQQRAPHTVRLMLTGNADISNAVAAVEAGEIHRYLTKPCTKDRLEAAIGEAIGVYHARRARAGRHAHLPPDTYSLELADVRVGDVLAGDLVSTTGAVLLRRGVELTAHLLERLIANGSAAPVREPVLVHRSPRPS